eukprot:1549280-Prymnesium_polylepis.1
MHARRRRVGRVQHTEGVRDVTDEEGAAAARGARVGARGVVARGCTEAKAHAARAGQEQTSRRKEAGHK